MSIPYILDLIGTLAMILYAVPSLFVPKFVAPYVFQTLDTPRGVAEFRIAHGGGFLAIAVCTLVVNHPLAFTVMGVGWLGAAGARLLAVFWDRPELNATYIAGFIFELAFGLMMVI